MTAARDWFRRHLLLLLVATALIGIGSAWGGGPVLVAVMPALPIIAWRYDNRAGLWLPLALLIVLAMGVMVALLGLIAMTHPR